MKVPCQLPERLAGAASLSCGAPLGASADAAFVVGGACASGDEAVPEIGCAGDACGIPAEGLSPGGGSGLAVGAEMLAFTRWSEPDCLGCCRPQDKLPVSIAITSVISQPRRSFTLESPAQLSAVCVTFLNTQ